MNCQRSQYSNDLAVDCLTPVDSRGSEGLDNPTEARNRSSLPEPPRGVVLAERCDPASVEAALGGDVGDDRGQQRIEIDARRLREFASRTCRESAPRGSTLLAVAMSLTADKFKWT